MFNIIKVVFGQAQASKQPAVRSTRLFEFLGQRPGLASLAPLPLTVLRGDELGQGLDKPGLAKAADRLLRQLQATEGLFNRDTGRVFRINQKSRKKMGDNADQTAAEAKAIAALKELVINAIVAERHLDVAHANPDVAGVLRLYAPLLIESVLYRVKLTVKEYRGQSQDVILHALQALEIENAPPGIFPSYSGAKALQTGQPTTGRTLSIADLLRGARLHDATLIDL